MIRTFMTAGLLAGVLTTTAALADDHVIAPPDSLKWSAGPPSLPPGAQIAIVSGDPAKEGLYVLRLKLPAGYKVPPHMHPNDENVTVISGTFTSRWGKNSTTAKGRG